MGSNQKNSRTVKGIYGALFVVFALFLAITSVFATLSLLKPTQKISAAASTNLNFQARLMTNSGSVVSDGFYNIEFNLYDVATGGTAIWTETRDYNSNTPDRRVRVVNGYLTVNLGSVSTFVGTNIDWSQEKWLTMKVGGSGTVPAWDAEMLGTGSTRMKLTAVPEAFHAQQADTSTTLSKTDGSNDAVLNFATPTADTTFTLQAAAAGSYTVCTSANEAACSAVYGGAGQWQTTSSVVNLLTSTDNVTIGSATNLGKLGVDGDADEIQLTVRAHGTQGADIFVVEDEAGSTDYLKVSGAGAVSTSGNLTVGGTTTSTGLLRAGTGGTNGTATGAGDMYVQDALEIDGETILSTVSGAGLSSDCSNSTTSKLLWSNSTKQFSCGTDQTGSGGGITGVGTFSNTATAKGLSISGSDIILHAASDTHPGAVNTTDQTFAGNKTFSGNTAMSGTLAVTASAPNTSEGALLKVTSTLSSTTNPQNGMYSFATVAPSAPSTRTYTGVQGSIYSSDTTNAAGATMLGVFGQASWGGGAFTGVISGGSFYGQHQGSSTVASAYGLQSQVSEVGTGTITDARGLYVQSAQGTITTNYGIYVDNQTVGTTDYGLYIQGAADYAIYSNSGANHFGGNVTGNANLTVNGNTTLGDLNSDTITFTGRVNSDILPTTNDSASLGSDAQRWKDIFVGAETIHIGTSASDESTIGYDTTANELVINEGGLAAGFRVESDTNTSALAVNGTTGAVTLGAGSVTVGNSSTQGSLILSDGSSNTTTIRSGAVASDLTFIMPTGYGSNGDCLTGNAGGTLSWASCGGGSPTMQNTYTNSSTTDPQITLTQTNGGIKIRDGSPAVSGNLFQLQSNDGLKTYFGVSATAMTLQDSLGNTAMYFDSAAAELRIYANTTNPTAYNRIYFDNTNNEAVYAASTGASTRIGNGTGDVTIALTGETDTLAYSHTFTATAAYSENDFSIIRQITGSSFALTGNVMSVQDLSTASGTNASNVLYVNQNNTGSTGNLILARTGGGANDKFKVSNAGTVTIAASQAYTGAGAVTVSSGSGDLTLQAAGGNISFGTTSTMSSTAGMTFTTGGATKFAFKPGTNSTSSFEVQNSAGSRLLQADSSNNRLYVGSSTADATAVFLILDSYNVLADPTGVEGASYYNTVSKKMRCFDDSTWKNCTSRSQATLTGDVINNNSTLNTMQDVTGLNWAVTAGTMYRFKCTAYYTAQATTTGSRWAITGPASPTHLIYNTEYSLAATTTTTNKNVVAYDFPAASNATSSTTTANLAVVEGMIMPSANGTVTLRFASEIANSAITAKAGSTCEWF